MSLIEWLQEKRPGRFATVSDYIEIVHDSGEHSLLWFQHNQLANWMQGDVREFYKIYDGADFFSSTFKIAAINEKKKIADVSIVFTLDEIQQEFDLYNFVLPEKTSAFMYQAGIGIYTASHTSSRIYECDTETGDVTYFESLTSIFQEWLDAVVDEF